MALGMWLARRRANQRLFAPKPSWVDAIGNTPVVRLPALSQALGADIYVKLEHLSPCGSSKDRIARQCIRAAQAAGTLQPGGAVCEGTSGSTGISLAFVARAVGAQARIWVPDDSSREKQALLRRLGVDLTVVPAAAIVNPGHYVNAARAAGQAPGSIFIDQFETPHNPAAHFETTGPEIWQAFGASLHGFVMGAGTGGMLAGVSRYMAPRAPGTLMVLADPPGSALWHKVAHGVAYAPQQAERVIRRHRYDTVVEGVGSDRVTGVFAMAACDGAVRVSDQESLDMSRWLLQEEGLFVGSSSAMHVAATVKLARVLQGRGVACPKLLTVVCDSGSRHLSRFWDDDVMRATGELHPAQVLPARSVAVSRLTHGADRCLASGSLDWLSDEGVVLHAAGDGDSKPAMPPS